MRINICCSFLSLSILLTDQTFVYTKKSKRKAGEKYSVSIRDFKIFQVNKFSAICKITFQFSWQSINDRGSFSAEVEVEIFT